MFTNRKLRRQCSHGCSKWRFRPRLRHNTWKHASVEFRVKRFGIYLLYNFERLAKGQSTSLGWTVPGTAPAPSRKSGGEFSKIIGRAAEKGSLGPLSAARLNTASKTRERVRERAGYNNYEHLKVGNDPCSTHARAAASRRNNPGNGRIANPVSRSLPSELPYQKPAAL